MTGTFILPLIVLPILIYIILEVIFVAQISGLNNQAYLLNCPMPIQNGIVSNLTLANDRVTYVVTYGNSSSPNNDKGSFFNCYISSQNTEALQVIIKPYSATAFNVIPYGYYSWVGDTIWAGFSKIPAMSTMIFAYLNAPTVVTGLVWFFYLQFFLFLLVALGFSLLILSAIGRISL